MGSISYIFLSPLLSSCITKFNLVLHWLSIAFHTESKHPCFFNSRLSASAAKILPSCRSNYYTILFPATRPSLMQFSSPDKPPCPFSLISILPSFNSLVPNSLPPQSLLRVSLPSVPFHSLVFGVRGWHHTLLHLFISCLRIILRLFQVCVFFSP